MHFNLICTERLLCTRCGIVPREWGARWPVSVLKWWGGARVPRGGPSHGPAWRHSGVTFYLVTQFGPLRAEPFWLCCGGPGRVSHMYPEEQGRQDTQKESVEIQGDLSWNFIPLKWRPFFGGVLIKLLPCKKFLPSFPLALEAANPERGLRPACPSPWLTQHQ